MNSGDLLLNSKEKILSRWEELSVAHLPKAQNLSRAAIRDHIPQVFTALCLVLRTGIMKIPEELSKTHGRQRSWSTDYSLSEVMSEYSILKNVIFDELIACGVTSLHEFRIVNDFFDAASVIATTEFVALREQELSRASDSLAIINMELETFAAIAAHDLRSPTATILGFADLIFDDQHKGTDSATKAVNTIKKTAHRMLELIDQLLEYAKIGKQHLQRSPFSLQQMAEEAKENLTAHIIGTGAEIQVEKLPDYEGDPILFRQLFQNLLSNSLKFRSPQRPCHIVVSGLRETGLIRLKVKDNGSGFDPRLAELIFQPFKRGDHRAGIQGSGLGLATAKKIVELHGGKISAHGQLGDGVEINIELPLLH